MNHINYRDITKEEKQIATIKTGDEVFDAFLSDAGGFVAGSAIYLTGTPGAGKTTLSVVIQRLLENCKTSLYSREMTNGDVMMQMQRYKIKHHNAYIIDKEMCGSINEYIKELDELMPSVVILDSIQIVLKEDFPDSPPEQAAYNLIQSLIAWAKRNNAVIIVIGHVNKDGSFEGKNTVIHLFDAHLEMIYNKDKGIRTLSWAKNRKGPVEEVLYYIFGQESIEFYTKEQYQRAKENKQLEDFVIESVFSFMNSLDRKAPGYKEFKAEIKKEIDLIMKSKLKFFDSTIKCIEVIHKKIEKYKI